MTDRVRAAITPPPLPASDVNVNYYKSHLDPDYWINPKLSDQAWRRKVGPDGIAWTTEGIPFKTSKDGRNIAVVTLEAVYPRSVAFPVRASGKTLYLMLSGITFAMQSHVVNVRATLRYADGSTQVADFVNPFDIGDCWGQYRCHDTPAAGFENLAGRLGPAGSAEVRDLTQPVRVDVDADLVAVPMKPNVQLESVAFETVANDVIFGVMGASILK